MERGRPPARRGLWKSVSGSRNTPDSSQVFTYLAVRVLSNFLLLTRLLHLIWHKMSN